MITKSNGASNIEKYACNTIFQKSLYNILKKNIFQLIYLFILLYFYMKNKKLALVALLALLLSTPMSMLGNMANAQTTVEDGGDKVSANTEAPEEEVSDTGDVDEEETTDEEESTDEEETTDEDMEAMEEAVELEATMTLERDEEASEESLKEYTRITATIDPAILKGINITGKAKLQFNVCGYNAEDEKCVPMTEMGDFSKSYILRVAAATMDGTETPIQVSVMNKTGELTRLASTTDLYTPEKDNEAESGYGFYQMVVDLGQSDTIHEPITLTIDLVGNQMKYASALTENSLSLGRLAVIANVKEMTNIPVTLLVPVEPMEEEPEEMPLIEEPTPVKPAEVEKTDTGIESLVLFGLLAVAWAAVVLRKRNLS